MTEIVWTVCFLIRLSFTQKLHQKSYKATFLHMKFWWKYPVKIWIAKFLASSAKLWHLYAKFVHFCNNFIFFVQTWKVLSNFANMTTLAQFTKLLKKNSSFGRNFSMELNWQILAINTKASNKWQNLAISFCTSYYCIYFQIKEN